MTMSANFDRGYTEGYITGAADYGGIIIHDVEIKNDQLEIYRLKELLCAVRECAVVDFNNTIEKLACKGLEKDFRIPESRFKEILESL